MKTPSSRKKNRHAISAVWVILHKQDAETLKSEGLHLLYGLKAFTQDAVLPTMLVAPEPFVAADVTACLVIVNKADLSSDDRGLWLNAHVLMPGQLEATCEVWKNERFAPAASC